ncbi:MAG: class I SAM-dependent methyltransferase [Fimbriiglobus sp.]
MTTEMTARDGRKKQSVLDPEYWRGKVTDAAARGESHRAVYTGTADAMADIDRRHREFVSRIGDFDSVLDVGCGYGRLLDLLGPRFKGRYFGIDLSPDLVAMARVRWPDRARNFMAADVRSPEVRKHLGEITLTKCFQFGVVLWVKDMVVREVGRPAWDEIQTAVEPFCVELLVRD